MAQDDYPADLKTRRSFSLIEADALAHARHCVFTTPSAARIYRNRYPHASERIAVIENGCDEESFALARSNPPAVPADAEGARPLVLLHSGVVYAAERDPTQLFAALGRLMRDGRLTPQDLRIRFRAAVNDDMLRELAAGHGAGEFIELCPAIPYREALTEMMSVDALLALQASNCNAQIPAKIYEYLRAGRPILGLTDPLGDTAAVLRSAGLSDIVPIDSAEDIEKALPPLVAALRRGHLVLPDGQSVHAASRRGRTEALAGLMGRVTDGT